MNETTAQYLQAQGQLTTNPNPSCAKSNNHHICLQYMSYCSINHLLAVAGPGNLKLDVRVGSKTQSNNASAVVAADTFAPGTF